MLVDKKIIYGHCFAIYALSTYTTVSGDVLGLEYAEKCFNLIQIYAAETSYGGYWEMFERDWTLCHPGAGAGVIEKLWMFTYILWRLIRPYIPAAARKFTKGS